VHDDMEHGEHVMWNATNWIGMQDAQQSYDEVRRR